MAVALVGVAGITMIRNYFLNLIRMPRRTRSRGGAAGPATVASVNQAVNDLYNVIVSLCRCAVAAADPKVRANTATDECRSVKLFSRGEAEKREAEVQQAIANVESLAATLSTSNSMKVHESLANMRHASWVFKDLVAFLKPIKESGLTTNSYQTYVKQVQDIMRQKLDVFLESVRPDVVESRRRSPVLAKYAEDDEKHVDALEFIVKTQPWSKASKELSSLKSEHERAVSSRPTGNGVHQGPGLVGAEVARPGLVSFPQGNNNALAASPRPLRPALIPAYIPEPSVSTPQRRVALPRGGRKTMRSRRSRVSGPKTRGRRRF